VFTCFGSANLGLPKNPRVAFYYEATLDSFGITVNPEGFAYSDHGPGPFLRNGFGSAQQPKLELATICISIRRPDADFDGS
jgi:cytochrome c peroxidase